MIHNEGAGSSSEAFQARPTVADPGFDLLSTRVSATVPGSTASVCRLLGHLQRPVNLLSASNKAHVTMAP